MKKSIDKIKELNESIIIDNKIYEADIPYLPGDILIPKYPSPTIVRGKEKDILIAIVKEVNKVRIGYQSRYELIFITEDMLKNPRLYDYDYLYNYAPTSSTHTLDDINRRFNKSKEQDLNKVLATFGEESVYVENVNEAYNKDSLELSEDKTSVIGAKRNVKSVVIREGVIKIDNKAFANCKSLKSITLPNSLAEIGDDAFSWCTSLKSIVLPDSVTKIGYGVFGGCESLISIIIPNTVTEIGEAAFQYCESLESIDIPNSITKINEGAFDNCKSLKSISIPEGLKYIGKFAFCNCISLESMTISNTVTKIGESAFFGCESLKSVTIPESVKYIGETAFCDCSSLESIVIPNSVTKIGKEAFKDSSPSLTIKTNNPYVIDYCEKNNIKYELADEESVYLENLDIAEDIENNNDYNNNLNIDSEELCSRLSDLDLLYGDELEFVQFNNDYTIEITYSYYNKSTGFAWKTETAIEDFKDNPEDFYYLKTGQEIEDEETTYVENMEEDIEKHNELNPKLFEGNNLRQDVKIALLDIVNAFVGEFKENNIDIKIKDAVIIGSNVSYNYTKDSDLDLHIIADTKNSKYSEDLLTLLYSAYRSIFNKNYNITIKGIPCEVYVELDSVQANSNGIYSLYSGWIKEPEHKDIPDIDKEEFDKLFKQWEDKYFNLLAGKIDTKSNLTENYNSLPFRKYRLEDEDETFITYIEDEKELIKYVSHHPEVAYVILYQLSNYPGHEDSYETSLLWDSEWETLEDLSQILGVDYSEESIFIEAMHPEIRLGWMGAGNRYLLDADTLTNYKNGDIIKIEIAPDLPALEYEIEDGSYLDDAAIEDSRWHNDVACTLTLKNGEEVSKALEKKLKSDITSDIEKNTKNNYLQTRFGGSSSGFPDFISVQLPHDKRITRGDHEDSDIFDAE